MTDQPSYPLSATPYGQSVATYFGGVFAPAKSEAEIRIEHHRKVMIKGLQANLLVALQRAIEDDPSIPSTGQVTRSSQPQTWWAIKADRIVSDLRRNDLRGLHAAFMIDCS